MPQNPVNRSLDGHERLVFYVTGYCLGTSEKRSTLSCIIVAAKHYKIIKLIFIA
jgi:hypothetical protein